MRMFRNLIAKALLSILLMLIVTDLVFVPGTKTLSLDVKISSVGEEDTAMSR